MKRAFFPQTQTNWNMVHKRQSNLATGGIASFLFTRWQQQFETARFGCRVRPLYLAPFPPGRGTPSNTVSFDRGGIPAKWHLNPSNGLSMEHECDRRQTERQTMLRRNV